MLLLSLLSRMLGILVSVPSKQKYEEEGGREGKDKREWEGDKEDEKEEDHLHYFFTPLHIEVQTSRNPRNYLNPKTLALHQNPLYCIPSPNFMY